MKTITFICFIIFFTSCVKSDFGDWDNIVVPPLVMDSSFKVTADIFNSDGKVDSISSFGYYTYFERHDNITPGDGSSIYFEAGNGYYVLLWIQLKNIATTGTYSFGHSANSPKEARVLYTGWNRNKVDSFFNDANTMTGTLTIDTLTTNRIMGSFNVRCWRDTQYVDIKNGIFAGSF